jgi:hypothetical protein
MLHQELGRLLTMRKRGDDAKTAYERSISLDPSDAYTPLIKWLAESLGCGKSVRGAILLLPSSFPRRALKKIDVLLDFHWQPRRYLANMTVQTLNKDGFGTAVEFSCESACDAGLASVPMLSTYAAG